MRAHLGCPVFEQQARKRRVWNLPTMVNPEIWLRHYGREEGCVTSEPVAVDCRLLIDVHPTVKQPVSDLDLVIVRAHVQQSAPGKEGSMCCQHFIVTPNFWWIDLFVCEGSAKLPTTIAAGSTRRMSCVSSRFVASESVLAGIVANLDLMLLTSNLCSYIFSMIPEDLCV